jgi:hypothetical protein
MVDIVTAMTNEIEKTGSKWEASGLFVPAGLFIGMGIGWAFDYLVQGLLIGLGGGFLAMALVRLLTR